MWNVCIRGHPSFSNQAKSFLWTSTWEPATRRSSKRAGRRAVERKLLSASFVCFGGPRRGARRMLRLTQIATSRDPEGTHESGTSAGSRFILHLGFVDLFAKMIGCYNRFWCFKRPNARIWQSSVVTFKIRPTNPTLNININPQLLGLVSVVLLRIFNQNPGRSRLWGIVG